jgi:S-adenosylmethionine synthetase
VEIDCFDTEKVSMDKLYKIVENKFNLTVSNIIDKLNLRKIDYTTTTNYCHFIGNHP